MKKQAVGDNLSEPGAVNCVQDCPSGQKADITNIKYAAEIWQIVYTGILLATMFHYYKEHFLPPQWGFTKVTRLQVA